MIPELPQNFELRCGEVHPVRCNVAIRAMSREEVTSRMRDHTSCSRRLPGWPSRPLTARRRPSRPATAVAGRARLLLQSGGARGFAAPAGPQGLQGQGVRLLEAPALEGASPLTTDLVDFYGRARRASGHDFSVTVKLTVLLGGHLSERYNHHHYAKAQNLGRRLRDLYAEALERFDLLVLPTTAKKARPIPADGAIPDVLAAPRRHGQPRAQRAVRHVG